MEQTPFTTIKRKVSSLIPFELIPFLPEKWEKIGAVVTLRLPDKLQSVKEIIGRAYAEVLNVSTVLNDTGGISGTYRTPVVEVIFGSSHTETIHIENGVRFKVDPQRIMFSSGNMAERKRMARIAETPETVVDLFAGIGYFTVPMAVYSAPKKIISCEINPVAYEYLCANVVLNQVSHIVEPRFGDNRRVAPNGCADRVVLGYLHHPQDFLSIAIKCLKNYSGILHYHELVPVELIPQQPLWHVEQAVRQFDRCVDVLGIHMVKSYAPRVNHIVLDVRISE